MFFWSRILPVKSAANPVIVSTGWAGWAMSSMEERGKKLLEGFTVINLSQPMQAGKTMSWSPVIVQTNKQAHSINVERTEALQKTLFEQGGYAKSWATTLVASPPARLTGNRENDEAGGVISRTWILPGSPVVFLQDSSPRLGLMHGTPGTVKRVVFASGDRPSKDGQSWPEYVLVHVPSWTGKAFIEDDPKTISVTPVAAQGSAAATGRRGWPFKVAFAITEEEAAMFGLDAEAAEDRGGAASGMSEQVAAQPGSANTPAGMAGGGSESFEEEGKKLRAGFTRIDLSPPLTWEVGSMVALRGLTKLAEINGAVGRGD